MPNSEATDAENLSDASVATPSDAPLETRWSGLVKSCLGGQLLPFLGAGVSYGTILDNDHKPTRYGPKMPATNELTKNILEKIRSLRPYAHQPWCHHELDRIEVVLKNGGPNTFADAAQLFFDLHKNKNRDEHPLYEPEAPLDMRLFHSVQPNPCHRYIAWLVRENVFSEIITTNYDCALEKAFEESWGNRFPHRLSSTSDPAPLYAISDHKAYRSDSHKRQREHHRATVPVLRLYKINGCSEAYLRDRNIQGTPASQPGFLVITERHLQSFSKRQWARDLFRDRFRCRKVIFSGFGAEEPQIRFTALDVLEEFQDRPDEASNDGSHCYLHVFENQLRASELQIAKAAVSPKPSTQLSPEPAIFTGQDKTHFNDAKSHGLTADAFWRCLYQHTIAELISRNLSRSIVATWLNEHEGQQRISELVIHGLRKELTLPGGSPPGTFPDWLRPFFEFTGPGSHTLLLMSLAWRVRKIAPDAQPCPNGYYEDVHHPESIPLSLLYLFHLLGLSASDIRLGPQNTGFWLSLPPPSSNKQPPEITYRRWLLITYEEPAPLPPLPDAQSRQAICLTLRTPPPHRSASKRRHKTQETQATTWRVFSLEDLIAAAAREPRSPDPAPRFRRALFFYVSRPPAPSFYESHRVA